MMSLRLTVSDSVCVCVCVCVRACVHACAYFKCGNSTDSSQFHLRRVQNPQSLVFPKPIEVF